MGKVLDVLPAGHVLPVLPQDGETEFVDFALKGGGETGRFKAEVESADASKEGGHSQVRLGVPVPTGSGLSQLG